MEHINPYLRSSGSFSSIKTLKGMLCDAKGCYYIRTKGEYCTRHHLRQQRRARVLSFLRKTLGLNPVCDRQSPKSDGQLLRSPTELGLYD